MGCVVGVAGGVGVHAAAVMVVACSAEGRLQKTLNTTATAMSSNPIAPTFISQGTFGERVLGFDNPVVFIGV